MQVIDFYISFFPFDPMNHGSMRDQKIVLIVYVHWDVQCAGIVYQQRSRIFGFTLTTY